MTRIVVIGGGGAGTGAATMAIQTDRSLDVTLITEFEDIAYSPCGIPYVFAREIDSMDKLFLQSKEFYAEMGIKLHTETVVERIDINRRIVYTQDGREFPFDKLILCTGWEYEVPDVPNVDLDGIVFIKNIRQAMEIDKRLDSVKRAVVWQAKPLGVELIDALPLRGIETHLVDSGGWILSDFADPDVVKPLQDHLAEHLGVKFHFGTQLLGFKGENGRLPAVETGQGDIECDVAFLVARMRPAGKRVPLRSDNAFGRPLPESSAMVAVRGGRGLGTADRSLLRRGASGRASHATRSSSSARATRSGTSQRRSSCDGR